MNLYRFIERVSNKRRFFKWEKLAKTREPKVQLTENQRKEILKVFSIAHKTNLNSNSFYSTRTRIFSPLYIPDSLWYAYIEPFFNHREIAKALDSKLLYNRILGGGDKTS